MKILHHIYAATCKSRGFGVFYQSPGMSHIEEDALNVIKRNATYKEPYLLNSNTDVEKYPINHEYYLVTDAGKTRSVLASSKYTGATNHTPDRRGNFITHTVVFDDFLGKNHISCLMDKISFRDSLTIEEESSFVAPADTIESPKENLTSLITENVRFLKSDRCYLNSFLEVIDLIMSGWLDSKGRNITLSALTNEVCKNLIFSLYSILPAYIINRFSFASYVASPSSVSFQICGVIPECGVTKLDPDYFKIIQVGSPTETYTPINKFTRVLKKWITNEQFEKIANLERLLQSYDIVRLDKTVEIPFEIEEFKESIATKTLPELNAILQGLSPKQEAHRKDLIDFVSSENPNLYLDYYTQEVKKYIIKNHSVLSQINILERCFRSLHSSYDDKQLLRIYKEIEDVLCDKTIISSKLLLDENPDIKRIIKENSLLCEYLLSCSEKKWNSVSDQDKEAIVKEYREWLFAKKYTNIQSWFSLNGIINEVRNGTFLDKVYDYQTILSNLSKEYRSKIFIELVETTNNKGKLSERTLSEITLLVDKYLDESFWKRLFDYDNIAEKDDSWKKYRRAWPLSMIKRYFVYFYVIRHEEITKVSSIIETLNEYESRWILEKLIETHHKDGHERLQSAIPTGQSPKKSGGWLLNRVLPRKK